jgi:hypothetical protein
MNIRNVVRSARLYARSEAMVAEIRLRIMARKLAFAVVAILTAVMGLAFLNLAAFLYLQTLLGPLWTPLVIGLANFLIAGIALLLALYAHAGPDLDLAKDLRNVSSKALEEEFQTPSGIGGLAGALGGSGDQGLIRLLLPAVISIVSSLGKRKAAPKK